MMFALADAGTCIHHHCQRGIGHRQFARQRRLRHAGHADHIAAIAGNAPYLGSGFQARSLGAGIGAAILQRHTGSSASGDQLQARLAIVGLGKIDMRHRLARAFKIGRAPSPGVINDLVRHHQHPRTQISANAANRGHRNYPAHRQRMQRP